MQCSQHSAVTPGAGHGHPSTRDTDIPARGTGSLGRRSQQGSRSLAGKTSCKQIKGDRNDSLCSWGFPRPRKLRRTTRVSHSTKGACIRHRQPALAGCLTRHRQEGNTAVEKRPFPQPHRLAQAGRHSEQTGADDLFNYLKLFTFKAITLTTQVLPRCSPPVRVFEGSQEKTLS